MNTDTSIQARHDAVPDNGDEDGQNATLREPISSDGTPVPGTTYTVPARCGRAVRVKAGQTIKIINPHGTQVGDAWIFNADHLDEFLSLEHTRASIERVIPRVGDPLVTNRRRTIAEFVTDTSPGIHDTQMAACDVHRYHNLGVKGYHDNCSDNLRMALKAIGLRAREVPAPFNLWMNIPIHPDSSIEWRAPVSMAGDYVEFRALFDCIVVISACPQDLIVVNALNPVELQFSVSA